MDLLVITRVGLFFLAGRLRDGLAVDALELTDEASLHQDANLGKAFALFNSGLPNPYYRLVKRLRQLRSRLA